MKKNKKAARSEFKKDGTERLKAGRQPEYDEPTETIAFRMPGSFKTFLAAKHGSRLGTLITKALLKKYRVEYDAYKQTGKLPAVQKPVK